MPSIHRPARCRGLLCLLLVIGILGAGCSNSGDDDAATTSTTAGDDGAATTTGDAEATTTAAAVGDGGEATGGAIDEFVPITDVPGVSDDAIAFAALGTGPASNPLGTCTLDCYRAGIEAYFAYRNSEGGLYGRELALTRIVDDELANNQVKALEIIDADDTFGVFAIPFIASGYADLAAAGVPLYTTLISAPATDGIDSAYALPGAVNCIECSDPFYSYVARLANATRVASLGYGADQSSVNCVAGHVKSIEQYGASDGIEMAYTNDELAFGLPNGLGPEVTAMKDAGVELIITCIDQNGAKTLIQELERQGMDDVTVMVSQDGYGSQSFLEESGELYDGNYMTVTFRPFEANNEGTQVEQFLQWMEETADPGVDLSYAMYGWIGADLAYQGLVAAGPDFDRASVIEATNAIDDYTAGGLVSPIDWSRQHQAPTDDDPITHGADPDCLTLVRITPEAFELVGDPDKPWLCWDRAEEDYTEPVAMTFE